MRETSGTVYVRKTGPTVADEVDDVDGIPALVYALPPYMMSEAHVNSDLGAAVRYSFGEKFIIDSPLLNRKSGDGEKREG